MKHLLLLTALLTSTALAQSDYAIDVDIEGIQIEGVQDNQIRLDLNLGSRYISANGAVIDTNGTSYPATGTCYLTNTQGLFCSLNVGTYLYTLDIEASMQGTIT
ncbi:unnamed protein product, partial [Discosporangium mesarthrocarpum]